MAKDLVIRARKFMKNKLLNRKQFVVDVYSPDFSNVSRKEVSESLAKKFKTSSENVVVFGMKYKFGGGRVTGFGLIYDNKDSLMKFEPKHRLVKNKVIEKSKVKARRMKKEHKNKAKKLRGKAKANVGKSAGKKK